MQKFDENIDFQGILEHFQKAKPKKDDQIAYTRSRLKKFNLTSSEKIEKIDSLQTDPNESLSVAQYYKAIEYFSKALKTCVNLKRFHLCSLYNGMGQAYFGLEKYIEAELFLIKSIEIFSDFSAPYANLAATYFEMGNYEKFFETCEFISLNFPISPQVWYYLAHAHENQGRYNIARIAYQNAIDSGMNECVVELSNLFNKMNNYEIM